MQGLEGSFAARIVAARAKHTPFTYIEIGVAAGDTLATAADLIKAQGQGWRAVGIEIPEGYDFSKNNVVNNCNNKQLTVSFVETKDWSKVDPIWNRVTVYMSDSHELLKAQWNQPIHFALIDGCHCKVCAIDDFLNIERYIVKDGVVAFHDHEPEITGHTQSTPHGLCDVFGACKELGLHDVTREGWSAPEILAANKQAGGHDMFLVWRTI